MSTEITISPTPNPNALKFILTSFVKSNDKVFFKKREEGIDIPLVQKLFDIRGVDHIHFFQNVVTISKSSLVIWDDMTDVIVETLDSNLAYHDPNFKEIDPEKERRLHLDHELLKIELIMDKTVRPALQADGGDLKCISLLDDVLLIKYEGACGTCPSSEYGTLNAIKSVLRDELNSEIDVYVVPE